MRVVISMIIPVCMAIANGCSSDKGTTDTSEKRPQTSISSPASVTEPVEHDHVPPLTVEGFSLTEENLELRYHLTNTSPHDIWVCVTHNFALFGDNSGDPLYRVADVRIADETLWIRRRANLEQNVLINGMLFAGYHRLPPGQMYTDTIRWPLPASTLSAVYTESTDPPHDQFSRIVLTRIVLEVGYFDEDLPSLMQRQQSLQQTERGRSRLRFCIASYKRDTCVVLVPYLDSERWDGLALERSVQATISNVSVPGVW